MGKELELCTQHSEYLRLGKAKKLCMENYRSLFTHHADDQLLENIRQSTNKGMAIGNAHLKSRLKNLPAEDTQGWKTGRLEEEH